MGANAEVVERFMRGWSDRSPDAVDETVAADAVVHYGDRDMDRDGLKGLAEAFFQAFPDGAVTVEEVVEEGDRVAVLWTYAGTHRGELFGIPPTGKTFRASGMNLERLRDGRIVEHWSVFDQMTAFRQLGLVPEG
jgi:steroid delta-isomerase-like uncharacterized protein